MKAALTRLLSLTFAIAILAFVLVNMTRALTVQWELADGDTWIFLRNLVIGITTPIAIWIGIITVAGIIGSAILRRQQARLARKYPDYTHSKTFPDQDRPAVGVGTDTLFLFRDTLPDTVPLAGLTELEFGWEKQRPWMAARYQDGNGYRYWLTEEVQDRDWGAVVDFLVQEGVPASMAQNRSHRFP
ncbi:hypothetical protein ACFOZ5_05290 [Marinobacter lacisalsi]|uniref:Uncharacterized protein n=1 Tax=Marinobacter lacisalsi TaxID=475979 RepID=A0ABV8QDT4_9GAMM